MDSGPRLEFVTLENQLFTARVASYSLHTNFMNIPIGPLPSFYGLRGICLCHLRVHSFGVITPLDG